MNSNSWRDSARIATLAELPQVVEVLSQAFAADPVWSRVLPEPAARRSYWQLLVNGASRFPCVFRTPQFEAVAVWIPPGAGEFLPQDEVDLPDIVDRLAGHRAAEVMEVLRQFDGSHPRDEPHYYLGLLGVRDSARGRGIGMALLEENLARIDAQHLPAYLESTNPINDAKYRSLGFIAVGSFQLPGDGPSVTRMWRSAK